MSIFFIFLNTRKIKKKKKKKRVEMIREKSKNEEEEVGVNEGRGATHYIHKWMARIASFWSDPMAEKDASGWWDVVCNHEFYKNQRTTSAMNLLPAK